MSGLNRLCTLAMPDRQAFYEERAADRPVENGRFYHRLIEFYAGFYIPPGMRVLEIGCGMGDLLASVKPERGVGIDFSPTVIGLARERHEDLEFHVAEAGEWETDETFDYIIVSDLVNDLPDVQAFLEHIRRFAHPETRLVVNFFNNLWRPILALAEAVGDKAERPLQNWLSYFDAANLMHLAGWEVVKTDARILWPVKTPLIGGFLNRRIAPLPLLWHLCLTIFMIARLKPEVSPKKSHSCTVVIPARNESGNIEDAVKRTPKLGRSTEILFIEGGSSDDTWDEIQRVKKKYPKVKIRALKQESKGKGGAVREAFAEARGDILFILDADLTVPPEDLPKFYEAIRSGRAEFVNGVRLVYPMESGAMQFCNMIANKLFGLTFSWLLGQTIKDTLCGAKVLFRKDYEKIAANRIYFGDFDPFGDFDLLFGAAKLNMRILDLPIRYRARTYGETNISRWSHGLLLFRMVAFAAKRLKFLG